jgi:hypothetical protein
MKSCQPIGGSSKRWHDNEGRAWLPGGIETRMLTGRRRMDVKKLTDRLNAPVQGTGADGLKLALALLWARRSECPGAVPVLVCQEDAPFCSTQALCSPFRLSL